MYICYIIGAETTIKVGYTSNIENRLNVLQTGNPETLEVLVKIVCATKAEAIEWEREWHFQLRGAHIRGEWFKRKEAMKLFKRKSKMSRKPRRNTDENESLRKWVNQREAQKAEAKERGDGKLHKIF